MYLLHIFARMTTSFRKGATGALLDEYERAIGELKGVIENIPDEIMVVITDPHTTDENCRSVQTILSHVVYAGYGYAVSIYNIQGDVAARPEKILHSTIKEYIDDLANMFLFTENVFSNIADSDLEQFDNTLKIKTGWGQLYDIEQLTEHAIVHILRHRRQIEKIIQTIFNNNE